MTSTEASSVPYYEEFAREYALFFSDLPGNMVREGEWLDRMFRDQGVFRVLDASCGSGRQAIPLAQRGYVVTGADPCGGMLREASGQATALGLRITWVKSGFTDLPSCTDTPYDAVIALGNGLCHQERREDIVASLTALRQCLRPGGLCLIGIKDFEAIRRKRPRFHAHSVRDDAGGRTILFEIWDFDDPILVCTAYSLQGRDRDWTVRSASTREYMLGAEEMNEAGHEAGFGRIERLDHPSEAVYALRD
jgi:SAM-dependent methyltransferase